MQQDFRQVANGVKAAVSSKRPVEVDDQLQLLKRISAAFVWMASR